MRRKKQYVKKSFESTGQPNDTSANIYMSMLLSNAWGKLTKNAQVLYLYCKAQYYAEKKKPIIFSTGETSDCFFTMNQTKWRDTYHLYKNLSQFYKDRDLLIQHGFIEIIENGSFTKTRNIYKLSDKWKDIK